MNYNFKLLTNAQYALSSIVHRSLPGVEPVELLLRDLVIHVLVRLHEKFSHLRRTTVVVGLDAVF